MLIKHKFSKFIKQQFRNFTTDDFNKDVIINKAWRSTKLIQMKMSTTKLQQELKQKIEDLKLNLGSSHHWNLTELIEYKFFNSVSMFFNFKFLD